jgi:hypothetical protein
MDDVQKTVFATQIYEPSSRILRVLKRLLVYGMRVGWQGWARHRVLAISEKALPFEALVQQVTGEMHPVFAMSVGNQQLTRKLTVLVLRQTGEVIGYIKLPLTKDAVGTIRREASTLERLWTWPAMQVHIPRVLYAGDYKGIYVLFRTPVQGTPGPTRFGPAHRMFFRNLWSVCRSTKPGEALAREVGRLWYESGANSEPGWEELAKEALRRSSLNLRGTTVPHGVMHGDFAPWNTRADQQHLLVFDWESSAWNAPLLWDKFHFQVQTACFLRKNAGCISFAQSQPIEQASYLLYLLSSAAQLIKQKADPAGIQYRSMLLHKYLGERTTKSLSENAAST